jgi:hypothetical protein
MKTHGLTSAGSGRAPSICVALLLGALTPACVGGITGDGFPAQPGGDHPTEPGKPSGSGGTTAKPGNTGMNMPPPSDPGTPTPPAAGCAASPGRIWALTPQQYLRTVKALLPMSGDTGASLAASLAEGTGFSNEAGRLTMTEPHVSDLLETVWELSTKATGNLAQLAPCLAAAPDDACLRTFITGFGARAFRRDLAPSEVDAITTYVRKEITGADLKAGLRRFFFYVFSSPHFLYRTELGPEAGAVPSNGPVALTGFERASSLSYFLTDGPPDAELTEAARTGALERKDEVEKQTRRLLAKSYDGAGFEKLFRELFETALPRTTDKDADVYPEWKPALAGDLAREGEAFIQQVLFGEDAKLSTLLTADFTMVNAALATYYGLPAAGAEFTKVKQKPERVGLYTQAGRMSSLAKANDTDAVARGRFIREALLCQPLPAPPQNLSIVPPPPDGKNTQRERLATHSADASCATCHKLMDPLGLAFESYDGIGRVRTMDVGKALDTSGVLTGALPEGAKFNGAPDLMKLLAGSPTVSACFVKTAFRYAFGRDAEAADTCTLDRLSARFAASGGDMRDLAVAIATDDSFTARAARTP